ncbi:phage virion morphogenesis protein [Pseudarthrobacter sp. P1]|uniref:phage virion morphogenesis protein n=1 Tax=Pseudarthrobacter sp. P1 TaxID=3418418 RepID=UPI003CE84266
MAQLTINTPGADAFVLVLDRFRQQLANASPAFEAMADHQALINKKQFFSHGAYGSGGWAPLSPAYATWKAHHFPGRGVLERTGDLRESLTDRPFGIDEITDTKMVIGTGVDYAPYHQNGTKNMPARPLFGKTTKEDTKVFAKILHSWIVKGEARI